MENISWDQRNYCVVYKQSGDPKKHKGEYPYSVTMIKSHGSAAPFYVPNNIRANWWLGNDYNLCNNKAVGKVEEQLAVISNLFEAIYERQEAYAMLLAAGKGILKFLRNWRKPKYWKKLKAGAQPSTLPQAWLAYNFGLMPLVGSINDALNLLGSDFPTAMVRGASGRKLESSYDGEFYEGWNNHNILSTDVDCIIEYRAYVLPNANPNTALSNVIGLSSPLSTIYSVIPWGWAVDYFVNVSELLSNFDNKFPGVKLKQVNKTVFIKANARRSYRNIAFGEKAPWEHNNAELVLLDRVMNAQLTYQPTWSFPMIGDNQAANLFSAIALTLKGNSK